MDARKCANPSQRADVVARLHEHQAQGHQIVIISGMLSPALELLRNHLGADGCIGTESEIRNSRYTGRSIPPVSMGVHKAVKAREFFQSRGMTVDWSASFAYGDSFTDRDMLELVGHPVAVYPDKKLHALAQAQNWEVLGKPK
jgi:HAD superfamily hydrolase (TIGR01490 family)